MNAETNYRGVVYPWQCDHMGHLNIMWYVGKFDEATWNLFARLGLTGTYLRGSGSSVAGVQQDLNYRREMFPGDVIEITTRVLKIGERSLRFRHEMRDAVTGEITATCEMTGVHLDTETRKAMPWPAEFRAAALERIAPDEAATEPATA
ncbi:MAG TPA: thioesterase family protein [Solirubrobacterales bacterium]|jgi:acyl-CoA thioester hydrolase